MRSSTGTGRLLLTFCAAAALLCWAPVHGEERAKPPPRPGRTEDDVLLFQLRLGGVVLGDSFPAFASGDGFVLPLGELCRELDLAIQVDQAKGLAEGFLIDEKRRFRLDVAAGTVAVGNATRSFDRSQVEVLPDDLYLDTRLLAACLPLDLKVDPRGLTLTVTPREQLPLQARWKREGEGGALRPDRARKTFPPLADPYRFAEVPAVDALLQVSRVPPSPGTSAFNAQGSVQASGDVLWMTGSLYALAEDPGGLTHCHLTLGRKDAHGDLLGPLHATQFALGEMLSPGLDLMAAATPGTGAMVTNDPMLASGAFDRRSFAGDLAQGWQVELYQNGALVGFQAARPDGRYEFLNLPLAFGPNDFRLVFYGPQGQRREETEHYDVSRSQTPEGHFHYNLSWGAPHDSPGDRLELDTAYGLTSQLTARLAMARLNYLGVDHTYSLAGLQGFWKPFSASLLAGGDDRGGTIAELGLRTLLGPLSVIAKETEPRNAFQSEVFQTPFGGIRRRTSLEFTGALPDVKRNWFSLDLGGFRDQMAAGGATYNAYLRMSATLAGISLSNQVTDVFSRGMAVPLESSSTGTFLASKVFSRMDARLQATYSLAGRPNLQNLNLTADLNQWQPYALQASYTHIVAGPDDLVSLGLIRAQGPCGLGASLSWSRATGFTASLNVHLGFGREPREGRVHTRAEGTAQEGAASVEAFLDTNGNGARDKGEKPIPRVGFRVNGAPHPSTTDDQGVAFLDGLSVGQDTQIAVSPATLDDPLMRPQVPGVRITPREGHVARIEIPVVVYSEISGTTYRVARGKKEVLPGLRLELRDAQGRVVKSLRSAYDGFYDFADMPPGSYTLEVPETATARLGLPKVQARPVRLPPEGAVLDGVDILLEAPRPGPPSPGPNK